MLKIQNAINVILTTKTKIFVNAKKILTKKFVRIALGLIRMICCVVMLEAKIRTGKSAMIVLASIRTCLCAVMFRARIGSGKLAMIVGAGIGI